MSNEPTNKHSMAHRRWERERKLTGMAANPTEEILMAGGDIMPGGGDPALKGFDPPDEPEGMLAKIKKLFSRKDPDRPIPDPNITGSSR